MPDLGKYAEAVLSAYAVSLILMIGIVLISVRAGRKIRNQLRDIETRQSKDS